MCFNISLTRPGEDVSDRFDAVFDRENRFRPIYHSSAFRIPLHPIICIEDPGRIFQARWGLIPRWIGSDSDADRIRFKTLNARSETLFEKPSFKMAARENRCLIPVTGFFEFREVGKNRYPYHIKMTDGRIFTLAGIYEDRRGGDGREFRTFSIVTAEANPLMEKIHNTKKRMPVILSKEEERTWLDPDSTEETLKEILKPYSENDLEAYPVSKDLARREKETDLPFIIEKVRYPELDFRELDSF
jgi:putative SOS response-associated peptidase YedK